MRSLADGYFELGEYEFAFYAHEYILFRTYDNGFDRTVAGRMRMCLKALRVERVSPFLDQFLCKADRMSTSELKRRQSAQDRAQFRESIATIPR
jgi:hypothetical protein